MTQCSPQGLYIPGIYLTDENPTTKSPIRLQLYKFFWNRMRFNINLYHSNCQCTFKVKWHEVDCTLRRVPSTQLTFTSNSYYIYIHPSAIF